MKINTSLVLQYWKSLGIPTPEVEFGFCPGRKWRSDFSWPREKLCLEAQGGLFSGGRHVRGAALLKEHEKLNALACLGWRVMFCVPKQLLTLKFAHQIKAALEYEP